MCGPRTCQSQGQWEYLEFYAGQGNLTRQAKAAGYRAIRFDILDSKKEENRKSNFMDLTSPSGFALLDWNHVVFLADFWLLFHLQLKGCGMQSMYQESGLSLHFEIINIYFLSSLFTCVMSTPEVGNLMSIASKAWGFRCTLRDEVFFILCNESGNVETNSMFQYRVHRIRVSSCEQHAGWKEKGQKILTGGYKFSSFKPQSTPVALISLEGHAFWLF